MSSCVPATFVLFLSELPLGDTASTSLPTAFNSFSSELPLGDTDSTQLSSPSSVPDFTSSAVSLVLSVPSSGILDFFLINYASPLVDGAPISSNSVASADLASAFATDVIEKSQDLESSSAPMAVLPSDFPAASRLGKRLSVLTCS